MKNLRLAKTLVDVVPRVSVMVLLASLGGAYADAQKADPPKEMVKDGYAIHQSWDLGGHIADHSGSNAVYNTMINTQSGPRILNQMLEMHAVDGKKQRYPFFDTLFTASSGYGGDPNNYSLLRMSKGKLYDFNGSFRRDRQYFDYNLLANPLVPAGVVSNGYTYPQIQSSPHLFNTVRRMTDLNLTLLPLSKLSFRVSYSHNINQGPSYSSIHEGADVMLYQGWRNSTDTWVGAVDWKPFPRTTLTYEQHVTHYKADTVWSLTGLNMQLSNGTPVTQGITIVANPAAVSATTGCTAAAGRPAVLNATTNPPTANPCVNGYTSYVRYSPTRTLFPTEEFRFQSTALKNFQMNGRLLYTGASMTMPNYYENFTGIVSRITTPAPTGATAWCSTSGGRRMLCEQVFNIRGNAKGQRINVSGDYGIVWKVSEKISLSDQYDFQSFRMPAFNNLTETDQYGASMLVAPTVTLTGTPIADDTYLGQKTQTNTAMIEFMPTTWASISVGHRYRNRIISFAAGAEDYRENQQSGLLGISVRPTSQLKLNGNLDIGYSDNAFVQISPRQWQQYKIRAAWKPKNWATVSGSFNDLERRDNVFNVGHLDHNRSVSVSTSITPNEKYGLDLSYGYLDIFTRTTTCYGDTFAPLGAVRAPAGFVCGNITATSTPPAYLGSGYYDAPTQYGSIGIMLAPIKPFRTSFGYRMTALDGRTELLNPRAVPGSLQSEYQSPYANITWLVAKGWGLKGDWNYYSYGEGSPIGPTAPRSFRGNVYTLGMHYEF